MPSSSPLGARSAAKNVEPELFTTPSPSSSPLARGPPRSSSPASSPAQEGGLAERLRGTVLCFSSSVPIYFLMVLEHEDVRDQRGRRMVRGRLSLAVMYSGARDDLV